MRAILKIFAEGVREQVGGMAGSTVEDVLKSVLSVVTVLIGIAAVVIIIVGGVSYATSQGEPGRLTKAKNTIITGVIGLVVCLLAFLIVNFVLGAVGS